MRPSLLGAFALLLALASVGLLSVTVLYVESIRTTAGIWVFLATLAAQIGASAVLGFAMLEVSKRG